MLRGAPGLLLSMLLGVPERLRMTDEWAKLAARRAARCAVEVANKGAEWAKLAAKLAAEAAEGATAEAENDC